MTTNNAVDVGLSGSTGTGNFVGSTSPTITTPKIITQVNDTNGNAIIGITPNSSAVNYIDIANNSTGNAPEINSQGSDTNIPLILNTIGTGGVALKGTGTNDNASSGFVGQLVSSVIAFASAVSLSSGSDSNVTSISLTAGDWDVWGNISLTANIAMSSGFGWISTTSATTPDVSLYVGLSNQNAPFMGFSVPSQRFSFSTTTTVYLSTQCSFASGTGSACGGIYARRRR